MVDLRRRTLLLAAALVASFRTSARVAAPTASAFGAGEFLRLSQRLTGRADLDASLASLYLEALLAVPGNADILARLARRARARSEPERALEGTILEWWYTGMYEVDGVRRVATHDDALMWRAIGRNAPGNCAGEFGAWSRLPQRAA